MLRHGHFLSTSAETSDKNQSKNFGVFPRIGKAFQAGSSSLKRLKSTQLLTVCFVSFMTVVQSLYVVLRFEKIYI